jgi:hypothetical protein
MTIKSAAALHGIRIGVGPVDPTGPDGQILYASNEFDDFYCPYPYRWPDSLDTATDANAALIVNEFGGALDLCSWAWGSVDKSHFGQALRWSAPGAYNFAGCDETYAFAVAHGMDVWISDPAYSGVPPWILSGGYTPAQLTTLLHDWYTAFYSRYPLAYATTLCNEMLPLVHDLAAEPFGGPTQPVPGGWYCVEWWFQNSSVGVPGGKNRLEFIKTLYEWAKAASPSIKVFMNQPFCEGVTPQSLAYAAVFRLWLQDMIALGTPIDGVGLQSHFLDANIAYDAAGYKSTIQSYDALGLEVAITEFDVQNNGPQWAQHHYNLIRAIRDSGCVTSLNFWCIKDPLYYGRNGALYATDWANGGAGRTSTPPVTRTAAADAVEAALVAATITTTPPTASLALSSAVPLVQVVAGPNVISPPTAALVLAAYAPIVTTIGAIVLTPPTASFALTAYAPVVSASAPGASALCLADGSPLALQAWDGSRWVDVSLLVFNGSAFV